MMRICALNDESNSNSNDEREPEVTREAQETIAISEYIRALTLKKNGKVDTALELFKDLLETQVLYDVLKKDDNAKLFSVKYNCYRNIGLIHEERNENEEALKYFSQAIALDETDIFTLNKTGHLALQFDQIELAMVVLKKCQDINPNHWPSADGLLQVVCAQEKFMSAYEWALHWHKKDPGYERALRVLVEIHERFGPIIGIFEDMCKGQFDYEKYKDVKREESCFKEPEIEKAEKTDEIVLKDVTPYQVEELTWKSIGDFIINLYHEFHNDPENLFRNFTWSDLLIKGSEEPDKPMESNSEAPSRPVSTSDGNDAAVKLDGSMLDNSANNMVIDEMNEGSDLDGSKTDSDKDKPKKRRGSDLSFLEQWGWHKNRRHSRKKADVPEPTEQQDISIDTFLRRIFSRYYHLKFDPNDSPFECDLITAADDTGKEGCFKTPQTAKDDDFQKLTKSEFSRFLAEFEYFDLLPLLRKWLEYVSKFWSVAIPEPLSELYVKIYRFYLNHYEFHAWSQMEHEEFEHVFRMGQFYVEQVHELVHTRKMNKSDMDDEFQKLRNQLMSHTGMYCLHDPDGYLTRMCRYHWANYCVYKFENNLEQALDSLEHIVLILDRPSRCKLSVALPNKKDDALIELELVQSIIKTLRRTISLNNVGNLYKAGKHKELVAILKDSLINCTTLKNADNTTMKITIQFEVLLESLWNLEDYEGCFQWSEKCLKYCADIFSTIPEFSYRLKEWGGCINFILLYLEALIKGHGIDIMMTLGKYESRLVQNIVRLVVNQLDSPFDKNTTELHEVDLTIPWILLYWIRQRDEVSNYPLEGLTELENSANVPEDEDEDADQMPKSFLILFTAHESLGRKSWCSKDGGQLLKFTLNQVVPILRTPLLEPYRDVVNEYLEQITYCLFAYPPKKGRSRHIEEHDAVPIELNWENAIELFDIYRPDVLPEFDAYKVDSITMDMEQLLQKILLLIPSHLQLTEHSQPIKEFIEGKRDSIPEVAIPTFPHRISSIFYLIADYHFKNRDFLKPTKFYIQDLVLHPWRFDSWAGLALSKATNTETKLNSCASFSPMEFLSKSENAMRCFEKCLQLQDKHTLLWIEYGSFAYMLHSYCSRSLKQASEPLSMEALSFIEDYKDKALKIAYNCFHTVDLYLLSGELDHNNGCHDEKWLYHYMLGKVAEKKKESPKVYLEHYVKAFKYLYECNATYPIRINHNNPPNLSIEALELFYRISSSIMKYLEQNVTVRRDIGRCFEKILKELSASPFAFNKAKLDNNSIIALKRKLVTQESQPEGENKLLNTDASAVTEAAIVPVIKKQRLESQELQQGTDKEKSPSRRVSQESTATSLTTTTTTSTSSSSSSSSSDSEDTEGETDENAVLTERELELIYNICVKNFEECLARFPEHYKSVNRLVHHYIYAPEKLKNLQKARELLLGTYLTTMGNKIQGLFADRKGNNFFNGIWRIPSSEIDRPGSFASHLSKGVILLIEVLKASFDYEIIFDLAVHLQRPPEADKKYVKECERRDLFQQAISCCCQSFRNLLKKHSPSADKRDDTELLNLLLEIYKTYRKCMKIIPGKESQFGVIMVEVYKLYVEGKVRMLPETFNFLDLACKLAVQELNKRKTLDKVQLMTCIVNLPGIPLSYLEPIKGMYSSDITTASMNIPNLPKHTTISIAPTPGLAPTDGGQPKFNSGKSGANGGAPRPRGRPVGSKNINSMQQQSNMNQNVTSTASVDPMLLENLSNLMKMYSNPNLFNDPAIVNNILTEYYKLMVGTPCQFRNPAATATSGSYNSLPSTKPMTALNAPSNTSPMATSSAGIARNTSASAATIPMNRPPVTTITTTSSSMATPQAAPKYDMKSLIASVASNILKEPTTTVKTTDKSSSIRVGDGQLTITPTSFKPKDPHNLMLGQQKDSVEEMISKKSYIPDLPKSLTITPSNTKSNSPFSVDSSSRDLYYQSGGGSGQPSVTVTSVQSSQPPLPPAQPKAKPKATTAASKKQQQNVGNPMAAMLPPSMHPGTKEYNLYMKTFQDAYAQMLKTESKTPSFVPNPPKKKRQPQPKPVIPNQGMMAPRLAGPPKSSNKTQSYPVSSMPQFPTMAFGPVPGGGATQQMGNASNIVPSSVITSVAGSHHQVIDLSPPKTLQQKLAERQKANSLLESKSKLVVASSGSSDGSKKPKKSSDNVQHDIEIIVLDE